MAKTRVTLRVKTPQKEMTITSIETPATPVSTVSIPDAETPASSISAKLQDDLVDSDASVSSYKKIPKKHPNLFAKDPMEIDTKPKHKKIKPTFDDDDDPRSEMIISKKNRTTLKKATTRRFMCLEI